MKSAIILVIIYASIAVAQVSIGLQSLGQHNYHGVSYQQFGISVTNGASGSGLTNSISGVHFFTVPDLLNPYLIYNYNGDSLQYSGDLYTICAQAAGWGLFSVRSSVVDSGHHVTISVVYNSNGEESIAAAVFSLSSSAIAKKDVESDSVAIEARSTVPTISPPGDWECVGDTPTWESLNIKAGTATIYNVVWNVVDPTTDVVIIYPPSNSYAQINANQNKQTSISMEVEDGTYPLNVSISYYLTSGGTQQFVSWTKNLAASGKRSAARKEIAVQTSSLRTEYAIGIASAGVAVAAVAVVAAVVIVRRKKDTVSDL